MFIQGCESDADELSEERIDHRSESIEVYSFEELAPLLYQNSDKTYIVNFWAMWCAPCVKEMPIFEEYAEQHPEAEILFVSLDFPEDIETKLKPFLKEKGIKSKVVILDDPDANMWIDLVNPRWSGALPYTIISKGNSRSYHERSFENLQELESEVEKINN